MKPAKSHLQKQGNLLHPGRGDIQIFNLLLGGSTCHLDVLTLPGLAMAISISFWQVGLNPLVAFC